MANFGNRIVVLIDMDCFFCQVEAKLNPEYEGKPLAVVQYNQWKLGGIIAVNYEARDFGVTRHMRGEEAKEKCPEIILASVPCLRSKSDTSRYRNAGRSIVEALKNKCNVIERASIDEAYLDITELVDEKMSANTLSREDYISSLKNTFVVGYSETGVNDEEQRKSGLENWLVASFDELSDIQSQRLAVAGIIAEDLRNEVLNKTGYKCSAGISYNKILAKLACGLHKPNKQTILPASAVPDLFSSLPVKKVRNLGGKFGDVVVDSLKCNVMADLLRFPLQYLQKRFDEKTGLWLHNISRGIDYEPVITRFVSKSIGACKKFPGKQAITTLEMLKHWLGELSSQLCDRLEEDLVENERRAKLLTVSFHYYQERSLVSQSKSCAMISYKQEKIVEQSVNIVSKSLQHPIAFLGLSAGKFVTAKSSKNFENFFKLDSNNSTYPSLKNEERVETDDNNKFECDFQSHSEPFEADSEKQIQPNSSMEEVSKFFRDNRKERQTKSPCTMAKDSLKADCFKKSFFMNKLKKNQEKTFTPQKLYPENADSEEVNEDIEPLDYSDEESNSERNNVMVDDNEQKINDAQQGIKEQNDAEQVITEENYAAKKTADSKNHELQESNDHLESRFEVRESETFNEQKTTVTLQEIFPDLNDIDANIIPLLPLSLQKEANKLLKNNIESKGKISSRESVATKRTKSKSTNAKSSSRKPVQKNIITFLEKSDNIKSNNLKSNQKNINSFLIKTDLTENINQNLQKCPLCDQLIPAVKFSEHKDYHIAQRLQQDMNESPPHPTGKRKHDGAQQNSPRKRLSDENIKSIVKSAKSELTIASFFK